MPRQRSIWSPVLHRCYSHGEVGDKGSFGDLNIEHDILGLWGIIHQFALDHSGGHPRGNSGLDFVAIKSYLINIVLKLARTYNCSSKTSHGATKCSILLDMNNSRVVDICTAQASLSNLLPPWNTHRKRRVVVVMCLPRLPLSLPLLSFPLPSSFHASFPYSHHLRVWVENGCGKQGGQKELRK